MIFFVVIRRSNIEAFLKFINNLFFVQLNLLSLVKAKVLQVVVSLFERRF